MVEHHGRIIGPAAWPAILDRDTWEAVVARLAGKAGRLGFVPSNAGRYLLSGIALCGTCGRPLAIRHNRRGEQLLGYGCIHAECETKVHRAARYLDAYVTGHIVRLLSDDLRWRERMAPQVAGHLVDELERLEERRERKIAEFADDDSPLAADVLRVTVGRIDARLAEVRSELERVSVNRTLDGLFGISRDAFAALALSRRRAAVRALVRVTVHPGRRGPGFDHSSVDVVPLWELPPG